MTEPLYCANHPDTETTLRCNRCEKPICTKCAVHVATGYRCKECVRAQQKHFDTAHWHDYLFGFFAALILSALGALAVRFIAGIWFGLGTLLFAPFVANLIVRVIQKLTGYRYSRKLFLFISVGVLLGALPELIRGIETLCFLFHSSYGGLNGIYLLLPLFWQAIYLAIVLPAVYTGLSGRT